MILDEVKTGDKIVDKVEINKMHELCNLSFCQPQVALVNFFNDRSLLSGHHLYTQLFFLKNSSQRLERKFY